MQKSIIDSVRDDYISDYLENASKVNYRDLPEEYGMFSVLYKDLPNTEVNGYPVASDFVTKDGKTITVSEYNSLSKEEQQNCDLRFYFLPPTHEIIIGTTGCGKTTGCVEPQLRAISSQKNKPNLFVTDPKGELFNNNAEHLQKQGYKLFVLNFKNLTRSDKWNPLLEVFQTYTKIAQIGKGARVSYSDVPNKISKFGKPEYFKATSHIEYQGMAFPNKESFESYLGFERDMLVAQVDSLINQIAHMMIKVQSNTDRSWEYGAQDLLKGLLTCMLEETNEEDSEFDENKMTMKLLQEFYLTLRRPILSHSKNLTEHPLVKGKSQKVASLMATALENAPNTMKSYCGVFDGAIKDWFQGHIFALTTGNTINFDELDDQPFAIFLITRDYEKSDFLIAGLFVDWLYKHVLEGKEAGTQTRTMHFLLDEFGNIPAINDFENKISTARSRDIWFHMVLQSYSQLTNNYNDQVSEIIKDNSAQIFLGSTNAKTKETFATACGKHAIPTLASRLNPTDNSICEVPLIPVSTLNLIKPGQIYTLRDRMPVLLSQFVRSYICAEQGAFADRINADGLKTCTPFNAEGFTAKKYTYDKLEKVKKQLFDDDDDDLLF